MFYSTDRPVLCFLLMLLSFLGWGQEKKDNSSFYREDQFYFGLHYLLLNSSDEAFEQQGLSSRFQIGILRDIPISRNGRWAIAAGIGYEKTSLRTNSQWETELGMLSLDYSQDRYTRFGYHSLSLPFELRWRSSSPSKYAFWRLYAGVKATRNWETAATPKGILQDWIPTAYFSFGYNTWNLYTSYSLQSIYSNSLDLDAPLSNLKGVALGLVFYVF
ncbi:MAG: outer membrane beta-barrel protein [Flavobacteriaceae bacterium]